MVPGLYFFVNGTTSTCLHNQCPRMIDYKGIGTVACSGGASKMYCSENTLLYYIHTQIFS